MEQSEDGRGQDEGILVSVLAPTQRVVVHASDDVTLSVRLVKGQLMVYQGGGPDGAYLGISEYVSLMMPGARWTYRLHKSGGLITRTICALHHSGSVPGRIWSLTEPSRTRSGRCNRCRPLIAKG